MTHIMSMNNLRRSIEDWRQKRKGRERSHSKPTREKTKEGAAFSPVENKEDEKKLARISDAVIYRGLPRDMNRPHPSSFRAVIDRHLIVGEESHRLLGPTKITLDGKPVSEQTAKDLLRTWGDLIYIKARRLNAVEQMEQEKKENEKLLAKEQKHGVRERIKDETHGSRIDKLLS